MGWIIKARHDHYEAVEESHTKMNKWGGFGEVSGSVIQGTLDSIQMMLKGKGLKKIQREVENALEVWDTHDHIPPTMAPSPQKIEKTSEEKLQEALTGNHEKPGN